MAQSKDKEIRYCKQVSAILFVYVFFFLTFLVSASFLRTAGKADWMDRFINPGFFFGIGLLAISIHSFITGIASLVPYASQKPSATVKFLFYWTQPKVSENSPWLRLYSSWWVRPFAAILVLLSLILITTSIF